DTAEGVSQLRENHSGLTDHLKKLQDERAKWKGKVDKDAFEANDKSKELFNTLTGVYKELKQLLEWNFPKVDNQAPDAGTLKRSKDGNELYYVAGKKDMEGLDYLPDKTFPIGEGHPLFKKNKDSGEFELTPAAEQKYLAAIELAAAGWDKAYAAAAEYIRKKSGHVDNSDPEGDDGKKGKPTDGGDNKTAKQGQPTNNGGDTPNNGGDTPNNGGGTPNTPVNTPETPDNGGDPLKPEDLGLGNETPEDGAFQQVDDPTASGDPLGGDTDDGTGTGGTDRIQQAIDEIKESATGTTEGTQQAANNQAANPLGPLASVLGPAAASMGLPFQQMLGGQQGMGGQTRPENGSGGNVENALYQPGSSSSPMPGADLAQASAGGAPTGAVAAADSTPAPNPNPNAMVDLKMQGVDPQQVPSGVAEALQKAMQVPNGSDANAAYAGIAAPDTPEHPWPRVEDGPKTGDVVKWGDQSAMVVVDGNGPRMISGQRLVPIVQGEDFEGFFRPPNGAQSAQTLGSASPATPSTGPATTQRV
ncbi:hypothetical protein, partial [Nocardia wallacei]|uniref:hypothetical protein n=1 Tax=Nocardia wallacei TaxID=480035 RepID=UPI003CC7E27A